MKERSHSSVNIETICLFIEIAMISSNNKETDCTLFMMNLLHISIYKGFKIRDILFARIWLTEQKVILLAYLQSQTSLVEEETKHTNVFYVEVALPGRVCLKQVVKGRPKIILLFSNRVFVVTNTDILFLQSLSDFCVYRNVFLCLQKCVKKCVINGVNV